MALSRLSILSNVLLAPRLFWAFLGCWCGLTEFSVLPQAHDTPVRAMTWSHNDMWMLTADHGGYIKYWQSNMNNVKMFQAHKEAIREARSIPNLPFSVVNPSLLAPLQCRGYTCRGLLPVLFVLVHSSLCCCSVFVSWMIDGCMCVLSQHCTDLSPVALDLFLLCVFVFSPLNHYVQKRFIFTFFLNKELTSIFIKGFDITWYKKKKKSQTRIGRVLTKKKKKTLFTKWFAGVCFERSLKREQ